MTDRPDPAPPGPGDGDALAAEYVLGLLDAEERAAVEARLGQDADLRADVARWTTDFAALAEDIAPVTPPPALRGRIEAALFAEERPAAWRRLLPWLAGAVAAGVIAVAALIFAQQTQDTAPHLYADLVEEERGLVLLAHWAPDSETFMVRRDAGALPEDRAYEIWLLPDPATVPGQEDPAPISIGLMVEEQLTEIPVPDDLIPLMTSGARVAISEEPPGGSTTGAPSGPILATGPLGIRDP